jgi:hypothetical protein
LTRRFFIFFSFFRVIILYLIKSKSSKPYWHVINFIP